jgi:hypothetical protein
MGNSTSRQMEWIMGFPVSLSPVIANFSVEDTEERALAQAAHKPLSCFRYVDDTFVIWPLESKKLERFFDHLNGLHRNTQFTVDIEIDGHLNFLGIDIYRKPDGSLDNQVFQKLTNTKPYMSPGSHHHPS